LYRDKDYAAEAQFVLEQLCVALRHVPRHMLDLGCGTGLHAVQMAQAGISVTGVDRSADMVAIANNRKKLFPENVREHLDFKVGDIRTIEFRRHYDAVLSLFHVMSYLVEVPDLETAFQMARRHLHAGGAFIFDFWYGPAVLRHLPQRRVKTCRLRDSMIQRKTIPELDRQRHVVRVNYDIEIRNIASGKTTREREQHVVRYYFPDEIRNQLTGCGFDVVHIGEWMPGKHSTRDNSFSFYALAKVK
jgi:SAM-dependent methyltransferase